MWLSRFSEISPIILTVITIFLSIKMHCENKILQKNISRRDSLNQTRECILDIYNAYLDAFHLAGIANQFVPNIFVSEESYYRWSLDVESKSKQVMYAYNKAKLLFDDEELITVLKEGFHAFSKFNGSVNYYVSSGEPSIIINKAWETVSATNPTARNRDYMLLYQNKELNENFVKLCSTSHTDEIQQNIEEYMSIVGNDNFDAKFEKYLKISNEQN